jgi:uncharacterized protein YciI
MRIALLLAGLVAVFAGGGAAAQTATPDDLYVVVYRTGPKWRADNPLGEHLAGHIRYQQGLLKDGALVAGGVLPDTRGGLALIRAASAEAARKVADGDPAVTAGVFAADITRWTVQVDATGKLKGLAP